MPNTKPTEVRFRITLPDGTAWATTEDPNEAASRYLDAVWRSPDRREEARVFDGECELTIDEIGQLIAEARIIDDTAYFRSLDAKRGG